MALSDPARDWRQNPIAGMLRVIFRTLGVALGLVLVVVAVPLFFLPIPLGLPLFIVGLLVLAGTSRTAHRIITGFLRRHPAVWNRVKRAFGEKD